MNRWLVILGIGCIYGICSPVTARAEDNTVGYTVDIIDSETQIEKGKGYFNIQTRPGEKQIIQAVVKSLRKEPVKIKIFPVNAITSEQGQINYSDNLSILDKTLLNPITEIIKIRTPEITVANLEKKIVEIEVIPPAESYVGVKLGGISFQLQDEEKSKASVSGLFAYRIGIVTMEEDLSFSDSKTLKLLKVTPEVFRGKKTVSVRFQNPEPKVLADFDMAYSLKKEGSEKKLIERRMANLTMAPNSNFNFPIDLGVDSVSFGDYVLNVKAENIHGSWEFEEKFTISDKQAKMMNAETVFKLQTSNWIKYSAVGLSTLTIVCVVIQSLREYKWKAKLLAKKKKRKKRGRK